MPTLTASGTVVHFIFGNHPHCRLAFHFSRRSQNGTALKPLPILRHSVGFPTCRKERRRGRGRGVWAEEELSGSHYLEAEIYEFMERSANPMNFPSKDDLIAAGRKDLARAIAKEGGWLSYGWDSDEKEEEGTVSTDSEFAGMCSCEEYSRIFQHRMTKVDGDAGASFTTDLDSLWASSEDSSRTSTSGRPMDAEVSKDAGISGILSRLEKERSLAFGIVSPKEKEVMVKKEKSFSIMAARRVFGNVETVGSIESTDWCVSSNLGEGLHHHSGVQSSQHGSLMDANSYSEPGTWRSWSNQRSGDPLSNFEAAEIVPERDNRKSNINFISGYVLEKGKENVSLDRLASGTSVGLNCPYDDAQVSGHEVEIPDVCQDQESLLMQMHNLSDELEFQQDEIKNARDILRSTRAKLAVMEGKIALEVIEYKNVIEEKQMRLAAAEWSLSILRSVCIVWPNSASETLLAGSFDGWTSQWRMEKNDTGVFSLCLKLYPGRYEIKFIVDGVWTVDPLRPVANNNGIQNNLLIVT